MSTQSLMFSEADIRQLLREMIAEKPDIVLCHPAAIPIAIEMELPAAARPPLRNSKGEIVPELGSKEAGRLYGR